MKSKKPENEKKASLWKPFKKKDSPLDEHPQEARGVRLISKKVSFGDDDEIRNIFSDDGIYGSAEDMQDKWGLSDKQATVKHRGRKRIVAFLVALGIFLLAIAGIFYILPRFLPDLFKGTNIELFVQPVIRYEYGDKSFRVVTKSSESIMKDPWPDAERISEVLYNEPVRFISDNKEGYCKIETLDGITGWVRSDCLTTNTSSVEPDLHKFKLVISDPSKNVMTHASNGTLITKVMMNTVIYGDISREGVYQVSLPSGETGWIGSSGVIELKPRDELQEVSSRYFVSSLLTFVNARYLSNGLTINGISINGAVYACSEINGIKMPRNMTAQSKLGQAVTLSHDAVTGDVIISDIMPGDIVFLRSPQSTPGSEAIYEEAVCTDTGTLLMISPASTTIRLRTFKAGDDITSRIITIRRVFATK
ncbi:MAG: SH3 domain-containing protein [Clostridiales bacterium]|nr:SH3 domain-containing protein [Clostridiales bacterium]